MMSMLRTMLNRFPQLKAGLRLARERLLPSSVSVSSHYVRVDDAAADSEAARLRSAWQSDELPRRQRDLVDRQLAAYRSGTAIDVFDVMVQALRKLSHEPRSASVLEVGCSSGYYSEVFSIAGLSVDYTGCDYSAAFIDLIRDCVLTSRMPRPCAMRMQASIS